jgi:ABC-type nitrate/sulfonate/bicarbonate transport system substrate-binding protein
MTIRVNVGGVPEHFNLAWHQAIENQSFKKAGFDIVWQDVPGGTGAMCKSLRTGELDIAIALTEGVIADIMQGNPSRILQFYVNSPLKWGIFVHANSPIQSIDEMQGNKYAISRYKSGSHLMAYVNAQKHGINIHDEDFVVVDDLQGARKALANNNAQLFLWEKFTTKPLVDTGEFRMIGTCDTPWPCFVIAASNQFLSKYANQVHSLLNIINLQCWIMMNDKNSPEKVANRYGILSDDAAQWFKDLEYACNPAINPEQFSRIVSKLKELNIIGTIPSFDEICYTMHIISSPAEW